MLLWREKERLFGGFIKRVKSHWKPHKNGCLEIFYKRDGEREEKNMYEFRERVPSISIIIIIIISFITQKQNASRHKQQATTRGLTSYL